jgi:hypothetical protein
MVWTNNDDVRWEPGETELTAGRVLCWLTTIFAALMFILAVADFFIGWAQGTPILRIFALVAAVLVWLIGRALRELLR